MRHFWCLLRGHKMRWHAFPQPDGWKYRAYCFSCLRFV